jgi:hypothetical protein
VLGFLGRLAVTMAWGELGHRAGLYRAAASALACGPRRHAAVRPCRVAARLGLEPESGSRLRTARIGGSPLLA